MGAVSTWNVSSIRMVWKAVNPMSVIKGSKGTLNLLRVGESCYG